MRADTRFEMPAERHLGMVVFRLKVNPIGGAIVLSFASSLMYYYYKK